YLVQNDAGKSRNDNCEDEYEDKSSIHVDCLVSKSFDSPPQIKRASPMTVATGEAPHGSLASGTCRSRCKVSADAGPDRFDAGAGGRKQRKGAERQKAQ